jgi:3-deoxy-7-phosphoheptulonate synthase
MVERGVNVPQSYRLVRRDARGERTIVRLRNGATFGGDEIAICAGPCGVESREQLETAAAAVAAAGANVLRGGAYKPRTSPYSFQGLGEEGLKMLRDSGDRHGLGVVTEVLDPRDVERVARYADMLQIGARNMQNFPLLREVGTLRMPVLLKRGLSATVQEWLLAAEYVMLGGNENVVLCERGVRSFDPATRNLLDIAVVPLLEEMTHLPVIVDPGRQHRRRRARPPHRSPSRSGQRTLRRRSIAGLRAVRATHEALGRRCRVCRPPAPAARKTHRWRRQRSAFSRRRRAIEQKRRKAGVAFVHRADVGAHRVAVGFEG